MFKTLTLSVLVLSHVAIAKPHMVCTNSGDINGSYILDITGYEKILNGSQQTLKTNLGFKHFRSSVDPIIELSCAKPNPFLEGPGTLLACYSGPVKDFGGKDDAFEAALFKDQSDMRLEIRGPGISSGYSLLCQIKDL